MVCRFSQSFCFLGHIVKMSQVVHLLSSCLILLDAEVNVCGGKICPVLVKMETK